jgi:outer membrane protein
MRKRFFVLALTACLSISTTTLPVQAMTARDKEKSFDINIGVYLWQTQYSGTFTITDYETAGGGSATILQPTDVQDDLNMGKETQYSFYITLEHNYATLPNLRFAYTDMYADSTSTLTKDILFNNVFFYHFNGDIEAEVDLSHTDISGYYTLSDMPLKIDLGLTIRQFNGFTEMRQPDSNVANTSRLDIDELVPLAYGNVVFALPVNGLSLDASLHFIHYDSNEVIDFNTAINYQSNVALGASLGYRSITADLDNLQNQSIDLKADGPYAAITFRF